MVKGWQTYEAVVALSIDFDRQGLSGSTSRAWGSIKPHLPLSLTHILYRRLMSGRPPAVSMARHKQCQYATMSSQTLINTYTDCGRSMSKLSITAVL